MENLESAKSGGRAAVGASGCADGSAGGAGGDWRAGCLAAAVRLLGLWVAALGFVAVLRDVRYVVAGFYEDFPLAVSGAGLALAGEAGFRCLLGLALVAAAGRVARFFGGCVAGEVAAGALFRGGCVLLLVYLLVGFAAGVVFRLVGLVFFSEEVHPNVVAQAWVLLADAGCLLVTVVACFVVRRWWGRVG